MTLVVKIGGSVAISDELVESIAAWNEPMVIVHGAHREMDGLAQRLGTPPRMVTSPRGELARYTDETAMDQFLMAYCGLVNKRLVERLRRRGVDAVGLSAMDGGIAVGRRHEHLRIQENGRTRILRDNFTGTIDEIHPELLTLLLDSGRIPVVCPPAMSLDGHAINVDGDRLSVEIAAALGAERVLVLMDRPGLLRDPSDDSTLISRLSASELDDLEVSLVGRAQVKLAATRTALQLGVASVGFAAGTVSDPIGEAMGGGGTWITE